MNIISITTAAALLLTTLPSLLRFMNVQIEKAIALILPQAAQIVAMSI